MKCQRCLHGRANYRVRTDLLDIRVCIDCAEEAFRLGLPVELSNSSEAWNNHDSASHHRA